MRRVPGGTDSEVLAYLIKELRSQIAALKASRAAPLRALRLGNWVITERDGELVATDRRSGRIRALTRDEEQ